MVTDAGIQDDPAGASSRRSGSATLRSLRELSLVPAIILVIVIGSFVSDAFLTKDNILNILQQSSELAVLVLAQTMILIVGKFDLSLESTVGLAPMVAAWLMAVDTAFGGSGYGLGVYPSIAVIFAVGTFVGIINGFLVVRMKLNAFIVTLAMLILIRGTSLGLTNGKTLFDLPEPFLYVGSARWFGAPVSIWIAGILFIFFGLMLRYHKWGRALYAIGGNADAARVAGIRVDRITWGIYIIGSILAALAGLMLTGHIASVVSSQGQNMIFYVFAAAVIGGISLNGGRGRIVGALTGVLLLGFLQNVLTLAEVAAFWIDAVYGAIILVALILARITGGEKQGL